MEKQYDRKYNYGIGMLRSVMAFVVILCHYWSLGRRENISLFYCFFESAKSIAAPCFMLISFYFLGYKLNKNEGISVWNGRVKRLLALNCVWSFLYFVAYFVMKVLTGDKVEIGIICSNLFWSLLFGTGRYLCPPLWFLPNLMFITVFVCAIFRHVKKERRFFVLSMVCIISLYMQYSGINYYIFGGLEYEQRYVGRLVEMYPYAYIGIIISCINSKRGEYLEQYRYCIMILCFMIITLSSQMPIFCELTNQFGYGGIEIICSVVCIFLICLLLPLENIPKWCKSIIVFLAKYTLGVYCLHWGVGICVSLIFGRLGYQDCEFFQCMVIWVVCYMIAYVIDKSSMNWAKLLIS